MFTIDLRVGIEPWGKWPFGSITPQGPRGNIREISHHLASPWRTRNDSCPRRVGPSVTECEHAAVFFRPLMRVSPPPTPTTVMGCWSSGDDGRIDFQAHGSSPERSVCVGSLESQRDIGVGLALSAAGLGYKIAAGEPAKSGIRVPDIFRVDQRTLTGCCSASGTG